MHVYAMRFYFFFFYFCRIFVMRYSVLWSKCGAVKHMVAIRGIRQLLVAVLLCIMQFIRIISVSLPAGAIKVFVMTHTQSSFKLKFHNICSPDLIPLWRRPPFYRLAPNISTVAAPLPRTSTQTFPILYSHIVIDLDFL